MKRGERECGLSSACGTYDSSSVLLALFRPGSLWCDRGVACLTNMSSLEIPVTYSLFVLTPLGYARHSTQAL